MIILIRFYSTVDCETEKHNEICNVLNAAIKTARGRVIRGMSILYFDSIGEADEV